MATEPQPGQTLQDRRKALNMRLVDVADQADCSTSLVSMVESGYRPRLERLHAIAHAVRASVGSFGWGP